MPRVLAPAFSLFALATMTSPLARASEAHSGVAPSAEALFNVGPLPVTNSMVTSWAVAIVLIVAIRLAIRTPKLVPSRGQAVVDGKPHVVAKVIGFGPHNGGQVLLVKDIVHAQEDDWETRGVASYGTPKPLRDAPRELRFLAIGKLDALVDAIAHRARVLIQAFDAGRKEQKNC